MKNTNKQVFLIVTQEISKHVLRLYKKIVANCSANDDVYLLYHGKTEDSPEVPNGVKVSVFTTAGLKKLNYQPIRTKLVPGSNHFPVLQFYLDHPEYSHYWCIEDDVTFSGNWSELFNGVANSDYDFITSHIRRYQDYPDWFWWDSYRVPGEDFSTDLINSFNPIYRISAKALEHVDSCLKNGYRGHHEVLLPTLLKRSGFKIADFGTQENHVTPSLSFCTLSSMRWKPVFFKPGNDKNKLYHPVKANINFDQFMDFLRRNIRGKTEYFK